MRLSCLREIKRILVMFSYKMWQTNDVVCFIKLVFVADHAVDHYCIVIIFLKTVLSATCDLH